MAAEALRFSRRFLFPDALLLVGELAAIFVPLYVYISPGAEQRALLLSVLPAALALASAAWFLATRAWRAPIARAARRRMAGEVLDGATRDEAYRALLRYPRRALIVRTLAWAASALAVSGALALRGGLSADDLATAVVVTTMHAFAVNVFRALWYRRILDGVRAALLPDLDALRLFSDGFREKIALAAVATGALGIVGIGVFARFFIPINLEQYVALETWFPPTILVLCVVWWLWALRIPRSLDVYLKVALSPRSADQPARDDPRAIAAYRAAQAIPYQLAVAKVVTWGLGIGALVVQAVAFFAIDAENATLLGAEALVITLGVALYEALWHRSTMRPLLRHVAARHRPSPEDVRTPLSLRSKMLFGFGVLALFGCGLNSVITFMQFKTLATDFIQRESELRLESIVAEVQERAARKSIGRGDVTDVLEAATRAHAPRGSVHDQPVYYYLPPEPGARPIVVAGAAGRDAAPPLPWAGEALMRRRDRGTMELSSLRLTGAYARVYERESHRDLGAIALLLPGYRGRGPSLAPQIQALIFSFLMVLASMLGIVILAATDLTRPIRELERRAEAMAKGDLTQPVVSTTGEGDEVGRLTHAFEEMRRELNEKFRSSTEINLSLEQEVSRRTAELERRNKELAEALEQLKRAQDELVRSEKMASMGRLVAGIAHEINNPVNAVVNTVGPLANRLEELAKTDREDLEEMIRVIQRGAKRTKEIVQALHNYSRGDDDRVVELDIHRGLDESLDLLRHHLKNGIKVERRYGEVGRVRARNAIHQVFMNLLTNAAQALGDKPGTIVLSTERSDSRVIVKISDDGPGIPAEILPRIFDPFFTTKEVGQGSGLGLSIVHGIVERHGGTIAVESEVGRGTTFTVTLPSA